MKKAAKRFPVVKMVLFGTLLVVAFVLYRHPFPASAIASRCNFTPTGSTYSLQVGQTSTVNFSWGCPQIAGIEWVCYVSNNSNSSYFTLNDQGTGSSRPEPFRITGLAPGTGIASVSADCSDGQDPDQFLTATDTVIVSPLTPPVVATSTPTSTAPAAPTITISANPTSLTLGQSVVFTWSSTNANSCIASGAWSGSEPTAGSVSIPPQGTGVLKYGLTCTGAGGSASSSAVVTVAAAGTGTPPPSAPTSTPGGGIAGCSAQILSTLQNIGSAIESGGLSQNQLSYLESVPSLVSHCGGNPPPPPAPCPASGCSGPQPVGPIGTPAPTSTLPVSCDFTAVEAQINAATDLDVAAAAARSCGLTVKVSNDVLGNSNYLITKSDGTFIAALSEGN
jgi:hypothetical protein